jgi:hypothetical protein
MSTIELNQFLEKLMKIDVGYAGMGGGSVGIVGATGTNDQVINSLRKNAISFATECAKKNSDPKILNELADQLQGSINATKLISGISDSKRDVLTDGLESLVRANSN